MLIAILINLEVWKISMSGKTVVALILAIPTYGISLALLIAYKFYQAGRSVNSIGKVLTHLGNEGTGEGTSIQGIHYLQAKTFLDEKGEHVESLNLLHTYLLKSDGSVLLVELNKEPQGSGAIFRVKNMDWLLRIHRWARAGNLPQKRISLADLYKLEIFSDDPLDDIGSSILDQPVESLPADFYRLPYLKKLFINGKALVSLGTNIGKMKSLEVLNVSAADVIPPEVGALENLVALQFAWGQVEHVPEEIGGLRKLRYLMLHDNRIASIPASIGHLPELTVLKLEKNRLCSLPESVTSNTRLHALEVGDNQLDHLPSFPRVPNRYTSIHKVDLGYNNFHSIPTSILDIDYIGELILCGNSFKTLPQIPPQMKVEHLLVFGEQKQLRLSSEQISWLKEQESNGCEIWLECEDLVLGKVDKWKERIRLRFYMSIGDAF